MIQRSEFDIGDFLVGIPSEEAKEYYKNTPIEEMVFIHNGYVNGDGYGILLGCEDGKVRKSTGFANFMWGGSARLATDDEKEKFMFKVMCQDIIRDY